MADEVRGPRPPTLHSRCVIALLTACLAAGCDSVREDARREDLKAAELADIGRPLEEQLQHVGQAVQLVPNSGYYRERRANLLFGLGRLPEAREDYDRAVELADRPYLRFERADLLCAQGEYDAALADLDHAIAGQPENIQFYPRRALARLAVGRVAEARADLDHAMAFSRGGSDDRYARAAVLLMEGKPAEAIPDLDLVVAQVSDPTGAALPRTLRLLAHTALDRPDLAATDFERWALDAEEQYPDKGYRYWFVPRGCSNAFIATQAGDLVAKALAMLSAGGSTPAAAVPSSAPPRPSPVFSPAPFRIVESTETTVVVDLDRKGIDPHGARLATLQLLDDSGLRIGERVAVRRTCHKICGDEGEDECHLEGEYRYSGPPVERFAVAFETTVQIRPKALDRSPLPRERQLAHLAQMFAVPVPAPVESETVFSWRRSEESGDWEEQYAWSEDAGRGRKRSSVERTGSRFADCSLAIYGPLTEFACPDRRSTYAGDRHLGGNNDPTLGSVVRYAAQIDGTFAYFVIVDLNSVSYVRIVFRLNGEWHEDGVEDDHTIC